MKMNRNVLLVAISLFAWGLGEGFFYYFQPLYLQEWGADSVTIGTIYGGVGIILALTQIPTGILTDKLGSRSLMWASWIIGVAAAWTMALAPSLIVFVIGYLAYGMTSFGIVPMNAYITSSRGTLSLGRALTFVSGMYNLGTVIGPLAGGYIAERLGYRTIYILASIIFMVSAAILMFIKKEEPAVPVGHQNKASLEGILKNPRLLFFLGTIFVSVFFLYLPYPFTPSFLQNQHGLSPFTIGILGAVGNLGNAFTALVLGSLAPYWGLVIGQLWVAVFAGLFLWSGSTWLFALGYFFYGGYRLYHSMILTRARTMVDSRQTGLLYGLVETVFSFAVILAPVLAGVLYENDPSSIYTITLIAIIVIVLINVIFLKKRTSDRPIQLHREQP